MAKVVAFFVFAWALLVWAIPSPASARVDCASTLAINQHADARPLQAEDLVGLIDIGSLADLYDDRMFTVSPKGGLIAVGVRRAMTATNSYCTGMYVVGRNSAPRLVDSGEGTIFWKFPNVLGKANFPTGFPLVITPRWAPDGKSVAYLKLINGVAQVWRVDIDGSNGNALTRSIRDVDDFRLTANGQAVVVKLTDDAAALEQRATEGLAGYHYDDRFSPVATNKPFLRGPLPSIFRTWDIDNGAERVATEAEIALFRESGSAPSWVAGTKENAQGVRYIVATRHGKESGCSSPLCTRVVGLPWSSGPNHIGFLRREGLADSKTAIFDWQVGTGAPRKLYSTEDLLLDCTSSDGSLICARETSKEPRHLIRIDPRNGSVTVLFDPNIGFGKLSLGRTERVWWHNAEGIACFGDLIYPVGYSKGKRYPLIVVQYTSRGFLRGGTGDEYPIQLFANRGYLVLSVQRPQSPLAGQEYLPSNARLKAEMEGFRERRSILSAIETEVSQLVADGVADPNRIGITGLSDGATTVQFALVNSKLFSAAAVSSCCWEPSQAWTLGPAIQAYYRDIGWPALTEDRPEFWRPISLARAAHHIDTPLLLQVSDDEYLATLESVTALRERNKPVDLYVFPEEHHVKREPAHRLAIYLRNIDWFDFWLRGHAPTLAPDDVAAGERWQALCRSLVSSGPKPCATPSP
ncbi:Atxe2 family lasso peptide isopeptidase [Sphingobium sp. V4]|uniref:Atxe2 family lasso peptide isopeptidase n=1 Tax=Sphingobium sp. V4 TaxID=3038927 RepID=UPI0025582D4F|nr:Atxe2 family lasso peptide isopeptidase [Sphingobium sp. V4]WIW89570.1 Atxe2 family lasso peptide isopeptidase [Sphingobium sp. V4]